MIRAANLRFGYSDGFSLTVESLEIEAGMQCAVMGPSGSGKTTLLRLLSGIYTVRSGELIVDGKDLARLSDRERRRFRISSIGMVFQRFELLDYLSALENVLLPFRINGDLPMTRETPDEAKSLMKSVGLSGKEKRSVNALSEGERQRLSLCRALITKPSLILADEPTASLDRRNADDAMDLLCRAADERGATLIIVTHASEVAQRFPRTLQFEDGKLR